MTSDLRSSNNRIDWIDSAKGICIIAIMAMYATLAVEQTLQTRGWMSYFVDFVQPFRMPDFFMISGLLVARVIDRPWRAYLDNKVLHFVYFYVLWVTIKFIVMSGHRLLDPHPHRMLTDYMSVYVQPQGPLWFIYILPLFFVAMRLVRALPAWLVLAAAIMLKLADLDTGWKLIDRFGMYFVFFYSGHAFAPQVFRLVAWAPSHLRLTFLFLAAWFMANAMLVKFGLTIFPVVQLLAGHAGVVAIFFASALLAPLPWMAWLRYLGRNSIVIYLGFVVPLHLMRKVVATGAMPIADTGTICVVVILASIIGALMMYWLTRNTPLRFLFERPAWAHLPPRRFGIQKRA